MKVLLLTVLAALVVAAAVAAIWLKLREPTPQEKLAALEQEVTPSGGIVLRQELQGQPKAFLLQDCKLYVLDASGPGKVTRTQVLQPGFYPWFTACTGQSIRFESGYLRVELSNMAFGAGGGNLSGGSYRSLDGLTWEKHTAKGWLPVDEAQD